MANKYRRLTELEFGEQMLTWLSWDVYPLEKISSIEFTDSKGVFYAPALELYDETYQRDQLETVITGSGDGYETREQLMRCVGRCWDKALAERGK
jgi:hypothetical protein